MIKLKRDEVWKIAENTYKCPMCDKTFPKKGIVSHILRVHHGVKFGSGYNGKYNDPEYIKKISVARNKNYIDRVGDNKEYRVKCHSCKKTVIVIEREKTFPEKERYYCNRSCANKRVITDEIKKKIQQGVLKTQCNTINDNVKEYKPKEYCCIVCGVKLFKKRKYCIPCLRIKRQENMSEYRIYRSLCKFKFNLADYPDEFNFDLIRENGWYSAANHGNNIEGVSRDHCISVTYGYKHMIPVEIISHPANCQLLIHRDNSVKHIKCSMTVEELMNKIEIWNSKYNA